MEIFLWSIVFLVSLVFLVKSADVFTSYSEKLGLALGLSSFIVGASIVAVGTSLPELVSSLFAVLDAGVTEFVADNIIGSNIANALLILGIGAVTARTLSVKKSLIDIDLPFFFSSMALFAYFALDKKISVPEAIFLLVFFVAFLAYTIRSGSLESEHNQAELGALKKQYQRKVKGPAAASRAGRRSTKKRQGGPIGKYILFILISGAVLAASAKFLIDSLLTLSDLLSIQSTILTVTVVAIGTSLPEVFTSIAAIKKGNHALAVGNVFGSNTFNLLLIGGVPALFGGLAISELTFVIALPYLVIATFVAIFSTMDNQVRLWEGIAMLFLYLVFLGKVTGII